MRITRQRAHEWIGEADWLAHHGACPPVEWEALPVRVRRWWTLAAMLKATEQSSDPK